MTSPSVTLTPEQIAAAAVLLPKPKTPEEEHQQATIDHLVNRRHHHQEQLRECLRVQERVANHIAHIKALEKQLTSLGWKNSDTDPKMGGPPQV